jgi:hypothetical protein
MFGPQRRTHAVNPPLEFRVTRTDFLQSVIEDTEEGLAVIVPDGSAIASSMRQA